jgi:hypothetical protein
MSNSKAPFSPEEFSSLGQDDTDKFVDIDIESGSYVIDRNDFAATERLLAICPNAQIWLARVGQRAAYRIGAIERTLVRKLRDSLRNSPIRNRKAVNPLKMGRVSGDERATVNERSCRND